jgi:hypothetical protein
MSDSDDGLHLSRDAALVLFEMLSRAAPDGAIRPVDSAEQRALRDLQGELERTLPEPFSPSYREILATAQGRLRDRDPEAEAPRGPTPLVVYVDVDDTLVRSAGSKRFPMRSMIERVLELRSAGVRLCCWSSGGADYAHRSAVELGLADCFVAFLAKPDLLIDDQPQIVGKTLACLHPNEASSMSVDEIAAAARRHGG